MSFLNLPTIYVAAYLWGFVLEFLEAGDNENGGQGVVGLILEAAWLSLYQGCFSVTGCLRIT